MKALNMLQQMQVCDADHEPIAFITANGGDCPLCAMICERDEAIQDKESAEVNVEMEEDYRRDAENDRDAARERVDELEGQIFELKDMCICGKLAG